MSVLDVRRSSSNTRTRPMKSITTKLPSRDTDPIPVADIVPDVLKEILERASRRADRERQRRGRRYQHPRHFVGSSR